MLKRILVLLGETPSSASARQYAFRLAQSTEAGVAGMSGIDLTYIEAPMLGGIGTSAYKVGWMNNSRHRPRASVGVYTKTFKLECRDHNVPFEWLSFEGDPIGALYLATETRDLVITGHDTAFCGNVHEDLAEVLQVGTGSKPACGDRA